MAPAKLVLARDARPALTEPAIAPSGEGLTALALTRESLAAFDVVEQDMTFQTSDGERCGLYQGVLLRPVLESASLLEGTPRKAELRRTFTVIAGDDYEVAFSVGEVHPAFGATPAMIAWAVDGAPLPAQEGLRLVVPCDTRGARNIYDVVR